MSNYQELKERANSKGINTFGDLIKACDVDARDLFGDSDWDPEMEKEYLYNCDAATGTLEILAEEGLI